MSKNLVRLGLTVVLFGVIAVSAARADDWNKRTVVTFTEPVEVAGHVLPAGTYVFQLADSNADRHIVQIFSADGKTIIATVLTIPDYRLTPTNEAVMKFSEATAGSPQAIRAWFHAGSAAGQEFVYRKPRALELARASNTIVPALAVDIAESNDVATLKTAPIVAVTPDATEVPVSAAIQTRPYVDVANARHAERLPKTASRLPEIALFGLGSILVAGAAMWLGRRAPAPVIM